jgi:2,3-bisphosphoglycerate-independent phosphoglycerate mutase
MDRGGHWNQTAETYGVLVDGQGPTARSAEECVQESYSQQIFDEMIRPTVIVDGDGQPLAKIGDNDAVIFFNFRQDRALQLTQLFTKPEAVPEQFRRKLLQNLYFATMTEYAGGLPVHVAFPPINLKNNLAEILAENKLAQFHIAESEKYAHVTAFFNCGRTEKWPGEERIIVTSPENSRNYVDRPEMSAEELTDILIKKISSTEINFFVANFANPDMVGHTGSLRAATMAVEYIDGCIKKIMDAVLLADAVMMITADHGNVEQMINKKTGDIDKDHTTNPVPFLLIANEFKFNKPHNRQYISLSSKVPAGVIGDVAPTVLELFGLKKPQEMSGLNLLEEIDVVPVKRQTV